MTEYNTIQISTDFRLLSTTENGGKVELDNFLVSFSNEENCRSNGVRISTPSWISYSQRLELWRLIWLEFYRYISINIKSDELSRFATLKFKLYHENKIITAQIGIESLFGEIDKLQSNIIKQTLEDSTLSNIADILSSNLKKEDFWNITRHVFSHKFRDVYEYLHELENFKESYAKKYQPPTCGIELIDLLPVLSTVNSLFYGITASILANFLTDIVKTKRNKINDVLTDNNLSNVAKERAKELKNNIKNTKDKSEKIMHKLDNTEIELDLDAILRGMPNEKRNKIIDELALEYALQVRENLSIYYRTAENGEKLTNNNIQ